MELQRQHGMERTKCQDTGFTTEPTIMYHAIRQRQPRRRERLGTQRKLRQRRQKIRTPCERFMAAEAWEASRAASLSSKTPQLRSALEAEREEVFAEMKPAILTLGDFVPQKDQQEQGQGHQNRQELRQQQAQPQSQQKEQQQLSPFSTLFSSYPRPPRWPTTRTRTMEEEDAEEQPTPCRKTKKLVRFAGDAETLDSPPPTQVLEFDPKAPPSDISSDSSSSDEEAETRKDANANPFAGIFAGGRPRLARPKREARARQARKDAEEICSLELDVVEDAAARLGVGERLLLLLKSLQQLVVFWEGDEKRTEAKFRFLGLEDDDMQVIQEHLSEADEWMITGERNLREAFAQMCEARRWLQDPEKARVERAQRRAETLRPTKSYP